MGLEPLSIILCLNIVGYGLILFKELNLLLAGKHWTNWKEYFNLIVKADIWILKFLAGLPQTVGQVEVIVCIFVECVEDGVYFNINLQILQYYSDNPLYFLGIRCCKQFSKCSDVIFGRINKLVQKIIELMYRKGRNLFAVAFYYIMSAQRKVTNSNPILMKAGVFIVVKSKVVLFCDIQAISDNL